MQNMNEINDSETDSSVTILSPRSQYQSVERSLKTIKAHLQTYK